MGTPQFAVPALHEIHKSNHKLVGVVTSPDMPAGRGLNLKFSEVKEAALSLNLPIYQPENLSDKDFIHQIAALEADVFVVIAFRKLPPEVFSIPAKGTINLHASLLPQYRGAAPMNWAIINGEKETGLTTFFINEQIDTGNVILSEKVIVDDDETFGQLYKRMSCEGSKAITKTLDLVATGNVKIKSQEEIIAEHKLLVLHKAPKIFKHHCRIDWTKSAAEIKNLVRGLNPLPCAWTVLGHESGKQISMKIYEVKEVNNSFQLRPGELTIEHCQMFVGAGENTALELTDIQPESKKRMFADAFVRGMQLKNGWVFIK